jgi:hypothetical protein
MDMNSISNICTIYDTFDFSKFILTHPESLQGGSFFTKLNVNNDVLYVQTPKCISKQGVVSSSGKKSYIDLMFSSDDSKFIEFMENLEKSCVEKIHEKRNSWFTNDIDENDIENAFAATLRPFKAGKYYLLRASIAPSKNLVKMPTCFVFDESENKLSLDDIRPENDLITVLEIQGIKFTSKSFQFEIILRQALIMSNKPVFQSCVIKKNIQPSFTTPVSTLASENARDAEPITLEISSVPKTIHDTSSKNNSEHTQPHAQPHTQHNLDKIINTKNNLKNQGGNEDDDDNANEDNNANEDDNANEDNNDTYNEDEDYNESVNKSDNNKLKNNVEIKSSPNNLEKIESLELTELTDADLEINTDENLKLKKPNDIYYEIYSAAKEKARTARKLAFDAYLEVKKIKKTYMLDDSDSDFSNSSNSDNDEDEDDNDNDNDDNENDNENENDND